VTTPSKIGQCDVSRRLAVESFCSCCASSQGLAAALNDALGQKWAGRLEAFLATQASDRSLRDQNFLAGSGSTAATAAVVAAESTNQRLAEALKRLFKANVVAGLRACKALVEVATGALVKGATALVFSFLLVLDLPSLGAGVRRLGGPRSRVRFAYNEIAPQVNASAARIMLHLLSSYQVGTRKKHNLLYVTRILGGELLPHGGPGPRGCGPPELNQRVLDGGRAMGAPHPRNGRPDSVYLPLFLHPRRRYCAQCAAAGPLVRNAVADRFLAASSQH
jgi:hypothetical protein